MLMVQLKPSSTFEKFHLDQFCKTFEKNVGISKKDFLDLGPCRLLLFFPMKMYCYKYKNVKYSQFSATGLLPKASSLKNVLSFHIYYSPTLTYGIPKLRMIKAFEKWCIFH